MSKGITLPGLYRASIQVSRFVNIFQNRSAKVSRKLIPNVEFIVVGEGDAADQLASASVERDLPVTVVAPEEVEPLAYLIERTWACVTVPTPRKKTPYGLAMLALSAGKPLISVGNLGENHGFQNHLNYIRVDARVDPSAEQAENSESVEVAYGLQLLLRWTSFALRIGLAGQRLVEERYSTRSVALVEGERLARIATNLNVGSALSDGAQALKELAKEPQIELEHSSDQSEPIGAAEPESTPGAEKVSAAGLDLVVAAIAASNGEEQTDDMLDGENAVSGDVVAKLDAWGDAEEPTGADLIAAAFGESDPEEIDVSDEFGDSSDQLEEVDIEIAEEISSAASEIDITSESISP